jgi:hypothetical protein
LRIPAAITALLVAATAWPVVARGLQRLRQANVKVFGVALGLVDFQGGMAIVVGVDALAKIINPAVV